MPRTRFVSIGAEVPCKQECHAISLKKRWHMDEAEYVANVQE